MGHPNTSFHRPPGAGGVEGARNRMRTTPDFLGSLPDVWGPASARCARVGCVSHFPQPKSNRQRFCSPACRFAATVPVDSVRYGNGHRKLRARMAGVVASGGVLCSRCGKPIVPGERWDLDHRDDGQGYAGAAHMYCNRAAPMLREPETYEDDPERDLLGAAVRVHGGRPCRWSRAWYDWRASA